MCCKRHGLADCNLQWADGSALCCWEHRRGFDRTARRVGLNIWPMVCRGSGLALLVLACTGLLAECVHEDRLRYICERWCADTLVFEQEERM